MKTVLRLLAILWLIAGAALDASASPTSLSYDRAGPRRAALTPYWYASRYEHASVADCRLQVDVVTAVCQQFAEISTGSDDGVRVGQELLVWREGQLPSQVIVRTVANDRAVVEIVRGFQRPDIQRGDLVAPPLHMR